jgi:pimeloyl-ACP methyl ester carboxylesterase
VILLPGAVLPAEPAYGALITALGEGVDAVAKDLEVYATPEPPEHYSLEVETAGVLREADAHGWERFHLVGYSGGGAASLAFAAARPERLASLALLEPGWAGNWDLSPADHYGEIANRLSGVFPDFELEGFEERHHFDPPHRIEPERLAKSLKTLWRRAEPSQR